MIRKKFIFGILGILMLFLIRDFIIGGIMYDPLGELQSPQGGASEEEGPLPRYETAWSGVIGERNIFNSPLAPAAMPSDKAASGERASAASEEDSGKEADAGRPSLKLVGVVLNQYGEFVALVSKNEEKAVPLRKGDFLDDVMVVEVGRMNAELLWNDETISLSIEKAKPFAR